MSSSSEAEPPAPAIANQLRDILAKHKFYATFQGIQNQPCRFLTSLCPNQCGHGAKVAHFTVTEYVNYEKPGQYGDDKQTRFLFAVQGGHGGSMPRGDIPTPEQVNIINSLQINDKVLIEYDHEYVTTTWEGGGSAKYPERPLRTITKV